MASNIPFQPPPRGSSQTPTGPRPHSARSNIGTPMRRPMSRNQLEPRGIPEDSVLGPKHVTKVHKSNEIQPCETLKTNTTPIIPQQFESPALLEASTPTAVSGKKQQVPSTSTFRMLFGKMLEYEDMLRDHESRMKLVESQQEEIKKLNEFGEENKKKIEALEVEKKDLSQKLKKYGTFHAQYKDHMNRVVNSQKVLLDEAKELQKISAQAIRVYSSHKQQSVVDQMGVKIQEIKEMRLQADHLVKAEKELLARVASAEETAKKFKADALAKQEADVKLSDSLKVNTLLKKDLEKNLFELSRAQHNSEQLHKQLTEQLDAHKELIKLLKELPSEVLKQFTNDEGALAKLLTSECTTQTKLDQAMNLVKELKTHEAQTPSSLIKLIEDTCSRIESKLETSDNNEISVQDSLNKLLVDFKERVGLLNTDIETQNGLHDRISEFRESNATLAGEKNAHELELQNMSNQLQESQRQLATCHDQLASKSKDLTALQILPKEDARLLTKVQELENTNSTLLGQMVTANEDVAKTKEELKSTQEIVLSNTETIRSLEDELSNAQARIEGFDEEKREYQAARKGLIDQEAQRFAKLSESGTKTMQSKFDSKMNNLRQKFSELEAELKSTKEDLQRAQNENTSSHTNSEKLLAEVAFYKKQSLLQDAIVKRLEEQCSGWEQRDQRVHEELRSTTREIQELRGHLATTRSAATQDLEAIFEAQAVIMRDVKTLNSLQQEKENENKELHMRNESANKFVLQKEALEKATNALEEEAAALRKQLELATNSKVEALVKEKNMLEQQNSRLQSQVESLQKSRHSEDAPAPRSDIIHREMTQQMQPPEFQKQKIGSHHSPSHPNFAMASQKEDKLIRGHMSSPKQMLRAAMKRGNSVLDLQFGRGSSTSTAIPEAGLGVPSTTSIPSSRRVSTRRSSNPFRSGHSETAPATIQSTSNPQPHSKPSASRAPSRRGSTRRASGLIQTGQNEDGEMLFSLNETSDSRFRAPPIRNSGVDRTSVASVTSSAIKPFSSFRPIDESPLTDLEPMINKINSLNTQEQLDEAYMEAREGVHDEVFSTSRSEKIIPDSQPSFDPNTIVVSQRFSEVDEVPIGPTAKKARTKAPTVEQESSRRRVSMPLKSALKNPQAAHTSNPQVTGSTSDANQSSYFPPPGPVPVLQNKSFGLGTNKGQTRPPKTNSYSRIASGISANSKAGSSSNTRRATASNRAPSKQLANGMSDSPLPKMPASRKRSFEAMGSPEKRSKRVSLPHGASTRVIADSQGRE